MPVQRLKDTAALALSGRGGTVGLHTIVTWGSNRILKPAYCAPDLWSKMDPQREELIRLENRYADLVALGADAATLSILSAAILERLTFFLLGRKGDEQHRELDGPE